MTIELYDRNYFERGIESGVSCYQNYRWIPELTVPLAMTIIDYLGIARGNTILDFGCAKGFLVKALRLLYRNAYGMDISDYALDNADPEIRPFCQKYHNPASLRIFRPLDYCIAKDVFEHIEIEELQLILRLLKVYTLFAIIPLGSSEGFIARNNDLDVTHITCCSHEEWVKIFIENGWKVKNFRFQIPGVKDSYYASYPQGHGFFTLVRRN